MPQIKNPKPELPLKRLNFFYLIDTSNVRNSLQEEIRHMETDNVTQRFKLVYKKIFEAGSPYINFLFSNEIGPYHSIFGEEPGNSETNNLMLLAQTAMFHQCILDEYKSHLNSSSEGKDNSMYIKLTASTVSEAQKKAMRNTKKENISSSNPDSYEHQKFYNDRKYFLSRVSEYSTKLVLHLRNKKLNESENDIFVYKTDILPVNFLLHEAQVKMFDTQLKSKCITKEFMKKYNLLKSSYETQKNTLTSTSAILFDMVLEPAYGFSFFESVYKLFNEMEHDANDKYSLALLKGEAFNALIAKYAASLPITYNKYAFLKYACVAISNSPTLDSLYLHNPANGVRYDSVTPLTEIARTAKSLEAIENFYHLLLYSTLPLIQDLWKVFSYELKISKEDYEAFILENYDVITYDYNLLTVDLIPKTGKKVTFSSYYDSLKTYIKDNPSALDNLKEENNVNSSPSSYNDICTIIQKHCALIDLDRKKSITQSLIRRVPEGDHPYYAEQETFIHNHAKNIADYCRILDRSVL